MSLQHRGPLPAAIHVAFSFSIGRRAPERQTTHGSGSWRMPSRGHLDPTAANLREKKTEGLYPWQEETQGKPRRQPSSKRHTIATVASLRSISRHAYKNAVSPSFLSFPVVLIKNARRDSSPILPHPAATRPIILSFAQAINSLFIPFSALGD